MTASPLDHNAVGYSAVIVGGVALTLMAVWMLRSPSSFVRWISRSAMKSQDRLLLKFRRVAAVLWLIGVPFLVLRLFA